jgi:hypothetical protein
MKRVYFGFIIFISLTILNSCSSSSKKHEIIVNTKVENVQINIGAITNITASESEHTLNSMTTRAANTCNNNSNVVDVPPEITSMPDSLTAYFIADESKGQYVQGEIVDTVVLKNKKTTVINGVRQTNYTAVDSVPAIKCKIYVTNYHKIKETLYSYFNVSIYDLPNASQELYLFGRSDDIDFSRSQMVEITISNPYAAVCIREASPVMNNPVPEFIKADIEEETLYYYKTDSTNTWYYLYILCPLDGKKSISTNTEVKLIGVPEYTNKKYILDKQIVANNVYTYTFHSGSSDVNAGINIIANGFSGTSSSVINVFE